VAALLVYPIMFSKGVAVGLGYAAFSRRGHGGHPSWFPKALLGYNMLTLGCGDSARILIIIHNFFFIKI